MVWLKCHISEETLKKYETVSEVVYDICEHLAGNPAYANSDIIVSDPDQDGVFSIVLGNNGAEDILDFDVTL